MVENRLRQDMPLQIDATVLYARGGGTGPLTDADFARDSPYNTYQVNGPAADADLDRDARRR